MMTQTDRMLLDTAHVEWIVSRDANEDSFKRGLSLRNVPWCINCEEHRATHLMPSGALLCLLCAVSELDYGHLHGDDVEGGR